MKDFHQLQFSYYAFRLLPEGQFPFPSKYFVTDKEFSRISVVSHIPLEFTPVHTTFLRDRINNVCKVQARSLSTEDMNKLENYLTSVSRFSGSVAGKWSTATKDTTGVRFRADAGIFFCIVLHNPARNSITPAVETNLR